MDFYNFFSFSAKKAIYRASEICAQFNNQYLEPEHIFYSILNLRSCSAVQVLHHLNVNLPKLTYSLEAHLYEHAGSYKDSASFSTRTLALLDISFKEVKRLHHKEIGTTHLLIGLSQERSQFLRNLFEEHYLDHRKIRDMFMTHLKGYSHGSAGVGNGQQGSGLAARVSNSHLIFSPHCQKLVSEAAYMCFNKGWPLIEPLHLFMAILMQDSCSAHVILQQLGFDNKGTLDTLQEQLAVTAMKPGRSEGISEHCKSLLHRAQDIQHSLRQRELLTAHILLEMLRDPDAGLEPIFEQAGLGYDAAFKTFLEYLLEDSGMSTE